MKNFIVKPTSSIGGVLSLDEVKALDNQLQASKGMSVFELHGYMTAIESIHEFIDPELWLSGIWEEEPNIVPDSAMLDLLSLVMRLYSQMTEKLLQDDLFFPLVTYEQQDKDSRIDYYQLGYADIENNLNLWCRGYMKGVALAASHWEQGDEDLQMSLYPFMLIAGNDLLPEDHTLPIREPYTLADFKNELKQQLPKLILSIYHYWRDFSRSAIQPSVQKLLRIGRNDPCPCGSGLKFKKCCIDTFEPVTVH
jgi:yecA family protein